MSANAGHVGKWIALNTYITKEARMKICEVEKEQGNNRKQISSIQRRRPTKPIGQFFEV